MEQTTLTPPPMETRVLLPKRDYRPLKLRKSPRRRGGSAASLPRTAESPPAPSASVSPTQEGTLKGSGRTQEPADTAGAAELWVATSETALMKFFDEGEWFGKVSVPTDLSTEVVLSRVTKERAAGKMAPDEAADILFPFLFEGTAHERRRVYAALLDLATPDAIQETARRVYRLQGYEGYLSEATSLLADFKATAWPTIRKWAHAGVECELLVGVITTIEGVADNERRDALMDIAQNGDENARRRVLESIHTLSDPARREVLQVLRGPNDPSDPVQTEAAERLAEYEV